MADTTLTVAADTSQASRAIADLSGQFSRLQGIIAGIGFGKLLQSSIDFANSIQQSSRATGIAIETTAAWADAVEEAGGNAAEAAKDLIDFTRNIDEAAQGSASAQAQFARIGVTLKDLGTLSNQALFEKTVRGIAEIGDASTRNRLAVQLLGKSFKDIDVRTVAAGFAATPTMDTAAIESAAAAQKNLVKIFNDFRLELLKQLQPISDFVKGLNATKETIGQVISAIVAVGAVLLTFTVAGRVITFLRAAFVILYEVIFQVSRTLLSIGNYINIVSRNFSLVVANIQAAGGGFRGLYVVISTIAAEIFGALVPSIEALIPLFKPIAVAGAAAFGWISESVDGMIKNIKFAYDWMIKLLGLAPPSTAPVQSPEEIANDLKREQNRADARKKELEDQRLRAENARKVIDANREQALAQRKIVDGYREANFFANLQMINERGLVGLNDERAAKQQKLNDFDLAYSKQIYDLTKQKVELERAAAVGTEEDRLKSAAFNKAYAGTKAALDKEYATQRELLSDNVDLLQSAQLLERDRLSSLDLITQQMERQATSGAALKDAFIAIQEAQAGVSFEATLIGKSPLQKQGLQITEDARKAGLAASKAFSAAFETMGDDGLSPERLREFEAGLQQIAKGYDDIANAQRDNLNASQSLEAGIKEAFNTFREEAENQANKAKRYFSVFANGFENIFTSMTKGFPGVKRAIKDLGASLVEEFLRIQAKNLLASILGVGGGSITIGGLGGVGGSSTGVAAGSGLLGALGKLFGGGGGAGGFSPAVANATGASIFAMGMAAGGPISGKSPIMVGERGPELFMPGVAGSIIPNNQLKGSESNSNNTNVTYNINAVDASSFRSLVARDPQFIYNITEVGRRSTPQRSV